jgi:hypothetical protein
VSFQNEDDILTWIKTRDKLQAIKQDELNARRRMVEGLLPQGFTGSKTFDTMTTKLVVVRRLAYTLETCDETIAMVRSHPDQLADIVGVRLFTDETRYGNANEYWRERLAPFVTTGWGEPQVQVKDSE